MDHYEIYKRVEQLPTDIQHIRSAFNLSVETTEQLREFSRVKKISLQNLAEIAFRDLLHKYDN